MSYKRTCFSEPRPPERRGEPIVLIFMLILVLSSAIGAFADVKLPSVISDNMVLQQGKQVSIWGWAEPGEKVVVSGSWQIDSWDTTADKDGKWMIKIEPPKAGGPYEMTISGENTIVLKNILVGEVWLCSGQSNMHFQLKGAFTGKEAIKKADYPQMRLFTVSTSYALKPRLDTSAEWEVCTPKTASQFSAVGFFFGRELYQELNVPVGLIVSAVGGTAAQLWTPAESLRSEPYFAPILEQWEKVEPEVKELYVNGMGFELWFDDFEFLPKDTACEPLVVDDFDDGDRRNNLQGQWLDDWFRPKGKVTFEMRRPGRNGTGGAARIGGWMMVGQWCPLQLTFNPNAEAMDMSAYNAIRFYSRGKGYYKIYFLQPSIDDWDNYSFRVLQATPEWKQVTITFKELKQAGWGVQKPFTPQVLRSAVIEPVTGMKNLPRPPSGLYNGMIAPLVPFGIRGAVWYQGESNAWAAYQYRKLLLAMIKGWRNVWGRGELPFLIVQLANWLEKKDEPGENEWAELREAQLMALELPATGLAVTIDIGDTWDIHPKNKQDVGHRLALWALGTTYGKSLVYSGPLYESMEKDGKRLRVKFKHTGSGLIAKGEKGLKGFAVAGVDRKFYWAEAEIEADTVLVWSDKVPKPVAVRYAWASNPQCNLYNREGLPASPFRTDDWPGITANEK